MADEQKVANEEYSEEVLATDTDPNSNPPKEADDSEGNDDDLFADLVADEDFSDEEVTEKEEPKPAEPEPAPEPVQQEQPQTPAPAESAPQQAAQELPQQPATGVEGAVPPTDINAQYKEFFEKSVDVLADQVYKFDEQTAEELDTNPSKVLPKIAAQLHMQVLTASITQVANAFPALMALHNDRNAVEREREDKFFGEYPHLKDHKDTVTRVAQVYHSMYPNDPYEVRAPKIAAMAMVEAKVPMPQAQPQPVVATPPIPTSARGAPSTPAPVQQKNEWTELIEDED